MKKFFLPFLALFLFIVLLSSAKVVHAAESASLVKDDSVGVYSTAGYNSSVSLSQNASFGKALSYEEFSRGSDIAFSFFCDSTSNFADNNCSGNHNNSPINNSLPGIKFSENFSNAAGGYLLIIMTRGILPDKANLLLFATIICIGFSSSRWDLRQSTGVSPPFKLLT